LCWFAHEELYVPYETMVKRIVGSTSSSRSMHRAIDYNSNHYRSMAIDAMRMNQGDARKCSIIDEEPNVNVTRFFDLSKDYKEPL